MSKVFVKFVDAEDSTIYVDAFSVAAVQEVKRSSGAHPDTKSDISIIRFGGHGWIMVRGTPELVLGKLQTAVMEYGMGDLMHEGEMPEQEVAITPEALTTFPTEDGERVGREWPSHVLTEKTIQAERTPGPLIDTGLTSEEKSPESMMTERRDKIMEESNLNLTPEEIGQIKAQRFMKDNDSPRSGERG